MAYIFLHDVLCRVYLAFLSESLVIELYPRQGHKYSCSEAIGAFSLIAFK